MRVSLSSIDPSNGVLDGLGSQVYRAARRSGEIVELDWRELYQVYQLRHAKYHASPRPLSGHASVTLTALTLTPTLTLTDRTARTPRSHPSP